MEGYIYTQKRCSGYFPDHIPLDYNTSNKLYDINDKPCVIYDQCIVNGRYLKQVFNSNSKYDWEYLLNNEAAFAISRKFWGKPRTPPQKSNNEYGNVNRINNNSSSTINYSNRSKDSNKYNNSIIKLNHSHPVDCNRSGGVDSRCGGSGQLPFGHHPDQLPEFIQGRPESRKDYSQKRSRICIKESMKDYFSAFGKRSRERLENKHDQKRRKDFNLKSGIDHNRKEDGRDIGRRGYNPEESRKYPGLSK